MVDKIRYLLSAFPSGQKEKKNCGVLLQKGGRREAKEKYLEGGVLGETEGERRRKDASLFFVLCDKRKGFQTGREAPAAIRNL